MKKYSITKKVAAMVFAASHLLLVTMQNTATYKSGLLG